MKGCQSQTCPGRSCSTYMKGFRSSDLPRRMFQLYEKEFDPLDQEEFVPPILRDSRTPGFTLFRPPSSSFRAPETPPGRLPGIPASPPLGRELQASPPLRLPRPQASSLGLMFKAPESSRLHLPGFTSFSQELQLHLLYRAPEASPPLGLPRAPGFTRRRGDSRSKILAQSPKRAHTQHHVHDYIRSAATRSGDQSHGAVHSHSRTGLEQGPQQACLSPLDPGRQLGGHARVSHAPVRPAKRPHVGAPSR